MAASVTEWIVESARKHYGSHGPGIAGQIVREAIEAKKYEPERHLDLRGLAEATLGRHTFEARLREFGQRAGWVSESTEAVDLSIFRGVIQGNVAAVTERVYEDSKSVVDQLIGMDPDDAGMDPMQTRKNPVDGVATDPPRDVAPATDYPRTTFSPYYTEAPVADKVGLIAVLPLEFVKANQSRRFINAAAEVARKVAVEERKRKLRVVLGITNNYKRNGTSYNTYLASGDRVNRLTDFVIASGPAQIDRVLQLFDAMTNPFTGEPMEVDPTAILTVRGNSFRMKEMLNADLIRETASTTEVETANPLEFTGDVLTDRYVYNLLVAERGLSAAVAATWTAIGDFQRAFKWREIEPFHTFEVGPNDEAWPPHFFQDIVYATKSRFWGVGYVDDPFAVAEAYNSSAT
jgi:hypothetical protein